MKLIKKKVLALIEKKLDVPIEQTQTKPQKTSESELHEAIESFSFDSRLKFDGHGKCMPG